MRRRALALLKIPPEPHPPMGDPASLRIFRAGKNYFRLRLASWAAVQLIALAAILFWAAVVIEVERTVRAGKSTPAVPSSDRVIPGTNQPRGNWPDRFAEHVKSAAATAERAAKTSDKNVVRQWVTGCKEFLVELAVLLPPWAFPLIWALKIFSFVLYLVQIPVTYAVRRLDYEMRWYMVTDRSLRLRHGVWKISESTMSFANLQQVTVTQDPLQRLLGLGDVRVQSAGGGGRLQHEHQAEDMHLGLFHSVTNAQEIRDLILDRLRRFRESGLGDPEESSALAPVSVIDSPAPAPANDALLAARELLAEARALRGTLAL